MPPYLEGPKDATIAIIGEAPGAVEVRYNRPFVGPAGDLLDRCLRASGLIRQSIYIDNVFQKRPANNDASVWLSQKHETEFWADSKKALLSRLAEVKPNLIVALGNIPLYTLTGHWGITKRRGSLYLNPELGIKTLACIHPSAALRQYLWTYLITFDLIRARKESTFPDLRLLDRNLLLAPTPDQIFSFLSKCRSAELLGFDIEVSREEVSHIAFATSPTDAICIPFTENQKDLWSPQTELQIWQEIASILEDPGIPKVTQNGTFDVTFLFRRFGIRTAPVDDTMIAQGILWPDLPKGLGMLTSLYCDGEPYYKDDGKKWLKNPFGDELTFQRYNAMDAAVLMEIWPKQVADLHKQHNFDAYQTQRALIEPLVFMGESGVRIDHERLQSFQVKNAARIESLEAELYKLCGREINYNSHAQVKSYFYIEKGLRPYTRKGRITTDDKALRRIAAKGYREATIILDLRHAKKMQGTYYTMQFDPDQRMRCSYNPIGTKSGRISSSKTIFGTGGNLQNQPPEMQACMLAEPGYLAISMDLAQAENRVVAFESQDPRMMEAFEKGLDIHRFTAALIYNIPYEEVTNDQRQDGKKANHGLNYGLSAPGFAELYQLPLDRAKIITESYHQNYSHVREWHARIRDQLNKDRTLRDCFGKSRVFRDRWGDSLFLEAYSFIPQSTVATKTNRDGFSFLYYTPNPLLQEARLITTIHDSIKFQVPISLGPHKILTLIRLVKENLETPIFSHDTQFSIPVDTKLGYSLDENAMLSWKASFLERTAESKVITQLADLLRDA